MPIRVLIADDSAFMRKALSMMLEGTPDFEVVGTARDGLDAVEKVRSLRPDVVTMDVEMPRMDGIAAVKEIMRKHPLPVVMVSSLTMEGAQTTIRALEAGAVDFIPKQLSYVTLDIIKIKEELQAKLKVAARSRLPSMVVRSRTSRAEHHTHQSLFKSIYVQAVAIGISTGGPFALQEFIPKLPADLAVPVLIVQHMPPHFTKSLADRLNTLSNLPVCEAEEGMILEAGRVYLAPGGKHLVLAPGAQGRRVIHTPDVPDDTPHKPSVDVLFRSVSDAFGAQVLGIVMTGMGKDGLEGGTYLKKRGGTIFAQNEESCVVYGMPRSIVEAKLADLVVPLDQMADVITKALRGAGLVGAAP